MNKVQSAISQVLSGIGVGVAINKTFQKQQAQEKLAVEKKQAEEMKTAEQKAKEEQKSKDIEKKQYDEAMDVAKRVALKRLGVSEESAEAYLQAEKFGSLNPRVRMRGKDNALLSFTAGTTARRMADLSLAGATYSKALTDASYRQKILSLGKTTKERTKNVLIAEKGGRV